MTTTREREIREMKAGQEIDTRIANIVFGWEIEGSIARKPDGSFEYLVPDLGGHWSPSQDIRIAWEVIEKLKLLGMVQICAWHNGTYQVAYETYHATADTIELAICRLALLVYKK